MNPTESLFLEEVIFNIRKETDRAMAKHGPMASPHEGISVIREEFEELWDEVKSDNGRSEAAYIEAIQLATMAVKYALQFRPVK